MNISERVYWIILIAVFASFSLLLGIWLIPQGIIEYSLGIGLLTSSVFMVLTIVFLSWLLNVREEREWGKVKNCVYRRIETLADDIAIQISWHIKNGPLIIHNSLDKNNLPKKLLNFEPLYEVANSLELDDSEVILGVLFDDFNRQRFSEFEVGLNEIIDTYLKLIPAGLTESLMNLQDAVKEIEFHLKLQFVNERNLRKQQLTELVLDM